MAGFKAGELAYKAHLEWLKEVSPHPHIRILEVYIEVLRRLLRWLSSKESACNAGKQFLSQEDSLKETMEPTPVFLPGKSHGLRSLVGYSPLDHKRIIQLSNNTA